MSPLHQPPGIYSCSAFDSVELPPGNWFPLAYPFHLRVDVLLRRGLILTRSGLDLQAIHLHFFLSHFNGLLHTVG